jgi:catechol 2,3-dioxygenase-like lactoylglutathione lyase family enzyme
MAIHALDHLVLTVVDLDATIAFYERALGMRAITLEDGRRALAFGDQKINLHRAGHEFEPKADRPTPGSGDLCFLTDDPINGVVDHLRKLGVPIVDGPVERTGARSKLLSVYVRDPDGNLLEIARPVS